MIKRKIIVDGESFLIKFSDRFELSFVYIVPYEKSIYCTDPLWQDWGWNGEIEEENFEEYSSDGNPNVNVFRLKGRILKEIVSMVISNRIEFFYWQPNDPKKMRIYRNVANELVGMLGEDWEVQNTDFFCYFRKANSYGVISINTPLMRKQSGINFTMNMITEIAGFMKLMYWTWIGVIAKVQNYLMARVPVHLKIAEEHRGFNC